MLTNQDQLEMTALFETVERNQEVQALAARYERSKELNELLIGWGLVLCAVCFLVSAYYGVKAVRGMFRKAKA